MAEPLTTAVMSVSGGLSSFYMLRYAAKQHDRLHGVFADVRFEDYDTYRVVTMCAEFFAARGEPFTILCDGRNPFDVFDDEHYLGNTHGDPCSRILKRELIAEWLDASYTPDEAVVAIGFDVDEPHRVARTSEFYKPYRVVAPLADAGVWGDTIPARFQAEYGWLPWAYKHGLPHSNCSGMCVKAGIGQWVTLLRERPAVYAYAETREEEFRDARGDWSILRDRRGGTTKALRLRSLREKVEQQVSLFDLLDSDDGGACSCFDPPLTDPRPLSAEAGDTEPLPES
jgi:hypothetical protein